MSAVSVVALVIAVLPSLPGFLAQVHLLGRAPALFLHLYDYAWFVGFAVAFLAFIWDCAKSHREDRAMR